MSLSAWVTDICQTWFLIFKPLETSIEYIEHEKMLKLRVWKCHTHTTWVRSLSAVVHKMSGHRTVTSTHACQSAKYCEHFWLCPHTWYIPAPIKSEIYGTTFRIAMWCNSCCGMHFAREPDVILLKTSRSTRCRHYFVLKWRHWNTREIPVV